jgi:hypothetical protein
MGTSARRRKILRRLFLWGMASLPSLLSAQSVSSNSSTAFPILSLGWGARAVAMGNSFTAVADDLSALHYNSAGLAQITDPKIFLMHNSYLDSGFYETLGLAYPLGHSGTLGFGLNYLNYGSIEKRDLFGNLQGTYAPYDISISGAYGFPLDTNLFAGFNSLYIRQDIDGVVRTGLVWDAGLLVVPFERFSLGLDLKNLGVETGGYYLPAQALLGAAYRLNLGKQDIQSLLLSCNGDLGFQGSSSLDLGCEYGFQKTYFLRAGYSLGLQDSQLGGANGLSFGAGVKVSQFQMDYAFSFLGDLGNMQRVSLSVAFPPGDKGKKDAKLGAPNGTIPPPSLNPFMPPNPANGAAAVTLKFQVTTNEEWTAQEMFDQAEMDLAMGLKKEALDLYLKVVQKDPNFEKAWMRLGKLYFDESLSSYRKVLEMNPQNEKLKDWLGHFKQ